MGEEKNRVKVQIMGEEYVIKGDAETEYLQNLAQVLDQRMAKLTSAHPRLTRTQIAVLTALNILDEYTRLQQDYKQFVAIFQEEK